MTTTASLEVDDIQGNILLPYDMSFATFFFVRINDPGAFRASITALNKQFPLPNATKWTSKIPCPWNIAFTYSGLKVLWPALPELDLGNDFKDGMAKRAAIIGDVGDEAPEKWDFGQDTQNIHALLTLYADSNAEISNFVQAAQQCLGAHTSIVQVESCWRENDGAEHFGFVDGISQPSIDGGYDENIVGGGVFDQTTSSWRKLRPGLFILGYETENGAKSSLSPLLKNGTFMVVRKLEQDVAGFRDYTSGQSQLNQCSTELVRAKMMGRWPNGSPIIISPTQPGDLATNDFVYKDDPQAIRCPFGSHVRRVNPRDSNISNPDAIQPSRRRIIRRGMLYGDHLDESAPNDGQLRGLIFVALNASIEDQFEFIQNDWVNGTEFRQPELPTLDPITGDNTGQVGQSYYFKEGTDRGARIRTLYRLRQFVKLKGGGYFFLPSFSVLRQIGAI